MVLETGAMATSPMWALIQPNIAEFARVVSCDRAGLGWSERGPRTRDARTMVRELHAALHHAGLPGPTLVGGTLGGPYATVFAATYGEETAALVRVDSTHPDLLQRIPVQGRRVPAIIDVVSSDAALARAAGTDPTGRRDARPSGGLMDKLPADAVTSLRTFMRWPGHTTAAHGELTVVDATDERTAHPRARVRTPGRPGTPAAPAGYDKQPRCAPPTARPQRATAARARRSRRRWARSRA